MGQVLVRDSGMRDGARCAVGLLRPCTGTLSAASLPYSGPGLLPAIHCWGVVLKGTWHHGFTVAGTELP